MREQGTPGLSIAITDRNATLRIITLGFANRDAQTPVTAQTRFAIGSITKSMTALALLQLHDAGRLDLDAPVARYLPWFAIKSFGGPILVHELLSHSAGLPDDFALEPGYVYDILALRDAETLFAPGTSWSYSNDGYATAGAILARLDGRFWEQSLTARVLQPLGMASSSAVFTPELMSDVAIGYQFRDNDRPPPLNPPLVPSAPMDFVDPAGSVLSTPEDMARYMRFYLERGPDFGRPAPDLRGNICRNDKSRHASRAASPRAPRAPSLPKRRRSTGSTATVSRSSMRKATTSSATRAASPATPPACR